MIYGIPAVIGETAYCHVPAPGQSGRACRFESCREFLNVQSPEGCWVGFQQAESRKCKP